MESVRPKFLAHLEAKSYLRGHASSKACVSGLSAFHLPVAVCCLFVSLDFEPRVCVCYSTTGMYPRLIPRAHFDCKTYYRPSTQANGKLRSGPCCLWGLVSWGKGLEMLRICLTLSLVGALRPRVNIWRQGGSPPCPWHKMAVLVTASSWVWWVGVRLHRDGSV